MIEEAMRQKAEAPGGLTVRDASATSRVPLSFMANSSSWRMSYSDHKERMPSALAQEIRMRDGSACGYCGVSLFKRNFVVDHIDGNHANNDPKNLLTACELCHDWRHLGRPNLSQEAILIYAPMIAPDLLQHVMRAAFIAKAEGGIHADGARALLRIIFDFGKKAAQSLLGTSDPTILGGALAGYPLDQQRKFCMKLQGIAMVPSGVRRADDPKTTAVDLFPQMMKGWQLAYDVSPCVGWDKLFVQSMQSISAAWHKIERGVAVRAVDE
jgi:hypothetical protein